ncbi:MAG: N-acetyltransferase, partial [Terracidiphilus sp.]|nr:N-acetyltransferase [Terracidiphilus sp.]
MKIRVAQTIDSIAIAALHAENWRSAYHGILSNKYLDSEVASERAKIWEERFRNPKPNQHIVVAEDQSQL